MTFEIVTQPTSVRPFRLWDATAQAQMRWRYYADKTRAHNAALIEARWAKVGVSIEVFDVRNGKLLGQYTRRVDTVTFMNGAGK
jgi:hypothetical protein